MALQYVAQNRMYLSPFGCESWAHRAYFKITSACGPDPGTGCSRRWTRRGPAWQRPSLFREVADLTCQQSS